MNKLQRNRLIKLRDFLREKVPNNLYKQDRFGDVDKNGHAHNHSNLDCGTPACALGWCTYLFPRHFRFKVIEYSSGWDFHLHYEGYSKDIYHMAENFFGIDDRYWAHLLFSGDNPPDRTAKKEADLIQDYLDKQEKITHE